MTASAIRTASANHSSAVDRARALGRLKFSDNGFRLMTMASALIVLILLLGVAIALFIGAWPAFREFGINFFVSDAWSPPKEKFGAATAIYGTLVTSLIAMLIAVPLGLGVAVFLTEICWLPLRRPIGVAIELLAGIPSIIYGITRRQPMGSARRPSKLSAISSFLIPASALSAASCSRSAVRWGRRWRSPSSSATPPRFRARSSPRARPTRR